MNHENTQSNEDWHPTSTDEQMTKHTQNIGASSQSISAGFGKGTLPSLKRSERNKRVAHVVAGVKAIRLPEPRQLDVMSEFDETRLTGQLTKGEPMLGMTLFEVTGAGKTTAAQLYAETINSKAEEGKKPVVVARLDNSGTAKSIYIETLAAAGDGFALNGTEQSLRRAALDALEDLGCELLIIDETNHGSKKSGFGGAVTSSVKLLLDSAVVPVALLGTEIARPIFARDKELSGRLMTPCHLGRLVWHDDYDREIWTGLLKALDDRLVADGIIDQPIGLAAEKLDKALMEATNGVIGQLMGMTRTAARNMARAERATITFTDLVLAVDGWNVGHGFITSNPLRDLA